MSFSCHTLCKTFIIAQNWKQVYCQMCQTSDKAQKFFVCYFVKPDLNEVHYQLTNYLLLYVTSKLRAKLSLSINIYLVIDTRACNICFLKKPWLNDIRECLDLWLKTPQFCFLKKKMAVVALENLNKSLSKSWCCEVA